jgi:hypothetical protein
MSDKNEVKKWANGKVPKAKVKQLAEVEKELAKSLLKSRRKLAFNDQERIDLQAQFLPPDIHDAIMRHD